MELVRAAPRLAFHSFGAWRRGVIANAVSGALAGAAAALFGPGVVVAHEKWFLGSESVAT